MAHINFAAHFDHAGHVFAVQIMGNFRDGHHVGGDIFARETIAAGRGLCQHAVFIADRNRQSVDLRLSGNGNRVVVPKLQEAAHASDKIDDVDVGKSIG